MQRDTKKRRITVTCDPVHGYLQHDHYESVCARIDAMGNVTELDAVSIMRLPFFPQAPLRRVLACVRGANPGAVVTFYDSESGLTRIH